MKKAGTITKICLFVITALVVLIVSFPHLVNATEASQNQDLETISTENKTSQKERKGKKDSSEKKTKFENLTDEEKEATTLPNQMMGGGMKGQMNQNGEMPNGGEMQNNGEMQMNGRRRGR